MQKTCLKRILEVRGKKKSFYTKYDFVFFYVWTRIIVLVIRGKEKKKKKKKKTFTPIP